MGLHVPPGAGIAIARPALARARPLIAAAALAGLVASGALICMHAASGASGLIPASWRGLPGWMAGPLPGAGVPLHSSLYAALFLTMCGCYALVLALARHVEARAAAAAIVLLHVLFLLAPPLLSADVFGYIDYARIGAVHGLDPYANGPASAPHDAVFAFMRWRGDLPSPYGPLFTVGSYALAPLSVAASLWALKLVTAAASLVVVWLVWDCARRLRIEPVPAAMLVGLNPLVLVWAVGGAHNDLLVVATVMAGVWLSVSGRTRASGAALAGATALKVSAGVVLPFLVAGSRGKRRDALSGALLAATAAAAITLAAFGTGVAGMLRAQVDQQNLVATASLPNQVGTWLGLGGATSAVRVLALGLFVLALAVLLVRTWHGMSWLAGAGWATLAMLATSAWLMPWYVTWALPLAALGRDRKLVAATLALCAYLVVMRTPL
jgi:hypothetical protein